MYRHVHICAHTPNWLFFSGTKFYWFIVELMSSSSVCGKWLWRHVGVGAQKLLNFTVWGDQRWGEEPSKTGKVCRLFSLLWCVVRVRCLWVRVPRDVGVYWLLSEGQAWRKGQAHLIFRTHSLFMIEVTKTRDVYWLAQGHLSICSGHIQRSGYEPRR